MCRSMPDVLKRHKKRKERKREKREIFALHHKSYEFLWGKMKKKVLSHCVHTCAPLMPFMWMSVFIFISQTASF